MCACVCVCVCVWQWRGSFNLPTDALWRKVQQRSKWLINHHTDAKDGCWSGIHLTVTLMHSYKSCVCMCACVCVCVCVCVMCGCVFNVPVERCICPLMGEKFSKGQSGSLRAAHCVWAAEIGKVTDDSSVGLALHCFTSRPLMAIFRASGNFLLLVLLYI